MQARKFFMHAVMLFIIVTHVVFAEETITVNRDEAVLTVSGAVCSFCALGIQKKLSTFSFIDTSKYNKGSLMDIENQRLTIALQPDHTLDLKQVYKAVLDGGYEPQRAVVNVTGEEIVHYDAQGERCAIITSPC